MRKVRLLSGRSVERQDVEDGEDNREQGGDQAEDGHDHVIAALARERVEKRRRGIAADEPAERAQSCRRPA